MRATLRGGKDRAHADHRASAAVHSVERNRGAIESGTIGALAQKLDAIDHEVGSLHERAQLLLDEAAVKVNALTNRRLFTLSILTVGLLPPTLVTGFFGMNTKDRPFQSTDGGTWRGDAGRLRRRSVSYWALRKMRAL